MHVRLIALAAVALLLSSCSSVYETNEFMASRTRTGVEDAAEDGGAKKADSAATSDKTETASAAGGKPAEIEPAGAAENGKTAANLPAPAKAAAAPPVRGLLAMFRSSAAPANPEAAAATEAAAEAAGAKPAAAAKAEVPVEEAPPDEISEADLAGEVEADPEKIAVPAQPADDGMKHDFVNVYTAKPDAPVEMIAGLPGVSWSNDIILASRTPDGEPGEFFGGNHPFARTVPGIPRQVVQAANGLLLAHSAINVNCVKPNLLGLVRRAEQKFGKKVVITSGYRSPAHNRRVRGARHSQHMFCNALDLYMPGVARDDLARFFFAQPDRGGIGLYCHTRSIHIDMGKRRQWRWACRGRGRG